MVHLCIKEKSGKEEKSKEIAHTILKNSEWSRLSCWVKPAGQGVERTDVLISSPKAVKIELKSANFAVLPDSLPLFDKGRFIRVEGAKLLNDSGSVIFRGVNLSAYSDDQKDDTGPVLGRCCEEDYREIAELGFNAVRLATWHKALIEPGGLDWLKLQISFARKHGLYIILDMHAPPGAYQGPDYKGKFWHKTQGAKFREKLMQFWVDIAKTFKDEPVIAAYDLLNEPKPKTNSQWHEYARLLISKIREQGDKHAIVVETCMLSDDDWPELDDKAIIYDTHFYHPWEFVSQTDKKPFGKYNSELNLWGEKIFLNKNLVEKELDTYVSRCRKRNALMQVGEYGTGLYTDALEIGGLDWLSDAVSLFNEKEISRFYWSWDIYEFAIHPGWFRRDPGVFREKAAKIATSDKIK